MENTVRQKKYALLLGSQIRTIRKARNLTQAELAFRSGLSSTYVGDVERGEETISIKNILFLAEALGVHHSELLNSLDDQIDYPRGEILVSIIKDLSKLEDKNLHCLRNWMDYILSEKEK